jgi:hypothetical protein
VQFYQRRGLGERMIMETRSRSWPASWREASRANYR